MSARTSLYELPVPSGDFSHDPILCGNVVRFSYNSNGANRKSGLIFYNVKAKRSRAEGACAAWHVEGTYDTLVEIMASDWVKEIMSDSADRQNRMGEKWRIKHYMIYLDGCGCIEIASESWGILPDEAGTWT